MAVTVLIKRQLTPGSEDRLNSLHKEMNSRAIKQEGYLGSEILKRVDADNQMLVISRWKKLDDWTRWLVSSERQVLQEQIDIITSADTKFEVYSD